jgi:hypothetical protein
MKNDIDRLSRALHELPYGVAGMACDLGRQGLLRREIDSQAQWTAGKDRSYVHNLTFSVKQR